MPTLTDRILGGVDIGDDARHLVRVAAGLAGTLDAELHLLHVRLARSTVQGRPVPPAQRETGQHEAETLLAPLAEEADAKGVEVAHRLLGTPTSGAGRRSPGSVLVVREPAGEPGDRL